MNIFHRIFRTKSTGNATPMPFSFYWTGAGFTMIPNNTLSYIRDGYTGNSAVYSVVWAQMRKFSEIPFYVYKIKNETKLKAYTRQSERFFGPDNLIKKAQAMDEVSDSHPVAKIIKNPNGYQTEADFAMMWLMFLKLTGGVPVYANMGGTGKRLQNINILPPQWCTITPNEQLNDIAKIYFSPFGANKNELPREQVFWARYPNPDVDTVGQHLYGLSPLKAGLMDMQAGTDATKAMSKMYQNGGARGAFTPKNPLPAGQVDQLRGAIDDWLNGSDNRNRAGAISVPLDFHAIGLDAVDMGLLQARQITDERICSIYNYPPALLKSDNKFDNASHAIKYLVTNTIYGDLVMLRAMYNSWLLPMMGYNGGEYYVDFDISVLPEMQEDTEKVSKQAIELVGAGIVNRNEARTLLKYDTVQAPEMEAYTVSGSIIPLADAFIPDRVEVTDDYQPAAATTQP